MQETCDYLMIVIVEGVSLMPALVVRFSAPQL